MDTDVHIIPVVAACGIDVHPHVTLRVIRGLFPAAANLIRFFSPELFPCVTRELEARGHSEEPSARRACAILK